ncbi:hypothetical protein Hanom_Chr04g00310051 [Helianthus anomalus]
MEPNHNINKEQMCLWILCVVATVQSSTGLRGATTLFKNGPEDKAAKAEHLKNELRKRLMEKQCKQRNLLL